MFDKRLQPSLLEQDNHDRINKKQLMEITTQLEYFVNEFKSNKGCFIFSNEDYHPRIITLSPNAEQIKRTFKGYFNDEYSVNLGIFDFDIELSHNENNKISVLFYDSDSSLEISYTLKCSDSPRTNVDDIIKRDNTDSDNVLTRMMRPQIYQCDYTIYDHHYDDFEPNAVNIKIGTHKIFWLYVHAILLAYEDKIKTKDLSEIPTKI